MRRLTALLVAVLVVVATVPAGVAAGTQATSTQTSATTTETTETGNATTDTGANETTANDSTGENGSDGIAPGEQLAGVVAVQQAEIDGELDSRSFEQRVSNAASNDSKARVVADQLNESRERLETLRERRSELRNAHEAGNLSRGRYQAQAARLTAEIRSLQRLLNRSSDVARELPADAKRANGIDSEEVERLRSDARNLSGDEVSDIARRIAGPNVGNGLADDDEDDKKGRGNGRERAPGQTGERGPPSANDSERGPPSAKHPERGPNAGDAPGRSDADWNVTGTLTGNLTVRDLPGRSADAPGHRGANGTGPGEKDVARGNETTTTEGDEADDGNGENGRGNGPAEPNGPAAGDADR
ncbi:DUF7096 domain-containing protein [Halopelagius longus]|nr:hypothetical protein [Halopelagius longus]RDI72869.1 hypothetical protein DWB78_14685 [Halopelagius longus]